MKKRAGRPPKKPKDRRDETLSLKLTAAELTAIKRAAGDVPHTVWARDVLLRAAK